MEEQERDLIFLNVDQTRGLLEGLHRWELERPWHEALTKLCPDWYEAIPQIRYTALREQGKEEWECLRLPYIDVMEINLYDGSQWRLTQEELLRRGFPQVHGHAAYISGFVKQGNLRLPIEEHYSRPFFQRQNGPPNLPTIFWQPLRIPLPLLPICNSILGTDEARYRFDKILKVSGAELAREYLASYLSEHAICLRNDYVASHGQVAERAICLLYEWEQVARASWFANRFFEGVPAALELEYHSEYDDIMAYETKPFGLRARDSSGELLKMNNPLYPGSRVLDEYWDGRNLDYNEEEDCGHLYEYLPNSKTSYQFSDDVNFPQLAIDFNEWKDFSSIDLEPLLLASWHHRLDDPMPRAGQVSRLRENLIQGSCYKLIGA